MLAKSSSTGRARYSQTFNQDVLGSSPSALTILDRQSGCAPGPSLGAGRLVHDVRLSSRKRSALVTLRLTSPLASPDTLTAAEPPGETVWPRPW